MSLASGCALGFGLQQVGLLASAPVTSLAPRVQFAPSALENLLAMPAFKAFLPIPILCAIAPLIWWFFRDTWQAMDREAACLRMEFAEAGKFDRRPLAAIVIVAVIMTMQEYWGGRTFYEDSIRPWLEQTEANGARFIQLTRYDELYGYAWWIFARVLGYAIVPFPVWKLLFPKDSLLDFGLRVRGFSQHVWIYGLCLLIVIPTMLIVANQPDFGAYYPFYKQCNRSWFDFLAWEGMYYVQFFALELFFRGFLVGTLRRSLGAASIFVMTLPYCMIHYGKPYLEANGAIVAGIVLGSLAARTKSIYAGFLVHVTVAASMDILSLWHRHAIPTRLWPLG